MKTNSREYFEELLYTNQKFRQLVEDYILDLEYQEIVSLSEEELKKRLKYEGFISPLDDWYDSELVDYLSLETLQILEEKLKQNSND